MTIWQVLAAVAIAWSSGALFGVGLGAPSQWRLRPSAAFKRSARSGEDAQRFQWSDDAPNRGGEPSPASPDGQATPLLDTVPETLEAAPDRTGEPHARESAEPYPAPMVRQPIEAEPVELALNEAFEPRPTSAPPGAGDSASGPAAPLRGGVTGSIEVTAIPVLERPSPGSLAPEPSAKILDSQAFQGFNSRLAANTRTMELPKIKLKATRPARKRSKFARVKTWIQVALLVGLLAGAVWGSYYISVNLRGA